MNEEKRILLIEDNPDDVELTAMAFAHNGIVNELVVARDGQEALDWLFREGDHAGRDPMRMPAIVLLDLRLPKVSGIEVLRRIREDPRTRLLPVIVLTSSNEERDLVASYELHANSFIRKPVDFERFAQAVRHVRLYWLLLNEPPRVD